MLPKTEASWMVVFGLILSWYTTSISLHLYNKWLFSTSHNNFNFPLFTTMLHMIIQGTLSLLALEYLFPTMKPKKTPLRTDYWLRVVPCGVATALDIGLSNSSMKYITLSFYTMVKSAAPVFVLLFAFLFGLEKISGKLTLSIILICVGVAVMVANETEFNLTGYIEAQLATIISGFRWALTQVLLKSAHMGMDNPLATNMFLAPVIAISLFTGFIFQEGILNLINDDQMSNLPHALFIFTTILGAGCIAFLMVNIEFQLIASTNVVTFSVAGIFKEITTITVSVMVFGDKLTGRTGLGLFISLVGIAAYNYARIQQKNAEVREDYEELDLDQFQFDDLVYEGIDSGDEDNEVVFDQEDLDELGLGDLSSRH